MKEVLINGVKYLPAAQLAKDFRYTSDYIGQLCRSKKVDAQLIGRSWYVNPESLSAVRQKRYSRQPKPDTLPEVAAESVTPVPVPSPLSKTTVKMQAVPSSANFAKRIDWKPVRYEDDTAPLLPSISKESKSTSLRVNFAESSDISIKTTTKSTVLVPDELPSVLLKGKLSVSSLEEAYDVIEEEEQLETFFAEPVQAEEVAVKQPKQADFQVEPLVNRPIRTTVSKIKHSEVKSAETNDERVATFNVVEWSFVVVDLVLVLAIGLVTFGEISLTATPNNFVENLQFETNSLQALLGQILY